MQIDPTTYADLSIFLAEEDSSIFHRLDFTRTQSGKDILLQAFKHPLKTQEEIQATQAILQAIREKISQWPERVTNGTLLVVEKFLDYPMDAMPASPARFQSSLYRLLHGPDFSLARYSLTHVVDLVRGLKAITDLFPQQAWPEQLARTLARTCSLLQHRQLTALLERAEGTAFNTSETIRYARFFHQAFHRQTQELIQLFGRWDAWYSMAKAMDAYGLVFPEVTHEPTPRLEAEGLFHLLLSHPVPYDICMDAQAHFIFLTGANMAGKSTCIKAVGLATFLAHLGMGVPAQRMRLSVFDGILSNINVSDNIAKGESYFYNEVHRIRQTIETIRDGRRWLVLIDEIFKGTNIQDAMKCSLAVIRGLLRIRQTLFILSTHLYEIGEDLKDEPTIRFRHFQTSIIDDQLTFHYQLREGISQDRFGYLLLQQEGVVGLLEAL
ncbi:MAG: DNA mismatch repair protein MutS [Bacteroidetes bacterium]|nr:DNA mismatch repair protein MutS [Bacteroidota bacterium]